MAAASYTTDLTTIATGDLNVDTGTWDESTDAGWDTGGAMVDDQNLYYNNTECVSAQLTKDSNGTGTTGPATIMYVHGSTWTIPTDGAVLLHHLWAAPPALNTLANGGVKFILGNGLANFSAWNCSGSDFKPAPKGGWTNYALNPAVGTADDVVGTGAASPYTTVGGAVGALQQARGNPHACNAIRYGRCTSIYTLGDVSNGYATFLGYGLIDSASTNKWNLLDPIDGGYSHQGLMSLGETGTVVDFRDSNRNISIANTINVTAGFNAIEIHNASSNVEWTAINITALGTVSKGTFEMIDNATVTLNVCVFTDMDTFIFQSNASLTGSTFRRCNLITHGGATLDSCVFDGYEGTAGTAYLLYNETPDPDGELDGCKFTKGTAATHAIEFGANTPSAITLRNGVYTDYNAANGNNDSTFYNNTGGALTINVVGATGNTTYRNGSGASTTIVADPVTIKIIAQDIDGVEVQSARTLVLAGATGPFPSDVTVTITSVTTTATVTHTAHGLANGDEVQITKAVENEYNGLYTISNVTADTYDYTIVATTSPATGTIKSTFVFINGLTDVNGEITDTRTYSSNQVLDGRVRKSSGSPYYKTSKVVGTVDSATGVTVNVIMLSDE